MRLFQVKIESPSEELFNLFYVQKMNNQHKFSIVLIITASLLEALAEQQESVSGMAIHLVVSLF